MSSYWIETTANPSYPTLEGDISVDVCIIGGGIVGVSCAYELRNSGLKVAILERDELCSHVTARSTAKITSQHGLFYTYLKNSYGVDFAKDYLYANQKAVENIKSIIQNEEIECDFSDQDAYVYTNAEEELEKIKEEVNVVSSLGFPCEYVTNVPLPISLLGAVKFPHQGQFNPRKYVLALANKCQAEIYTHTTVYDVKQLSHNEYEITTNAHTVHAKYVILASHYPIVNFPGFYFLKMYQSISYIIAVDTKCDLPDGMYINSEVPTYSFRTTPFENKKILLVAGSDHKTGAKIDLQNSYFYLEQKAKELYPHSEVLARWCTEDCISLDKIPYIGEFSSLMPNVFVATGFKKWGISTSQVASKIITDKILGKENPYEKIFDAKRLKPIKNYKELGNMVKESTYSLLINKLKASPDHLKDVAKGEGKIIEIDGEKIGVYQNENGENFFINPYCAHLGCELSFNNLEKTWDCPCHGSRFDYQGKVISEPAIRKLNE